jgi:hypothetical protein
MSDEELQEAEENLVRYVEFTRRMDQRLRAQLEAEPLTDIQESGTTEERSKN